MNEQPVLVEWSEAQVEGRPGHRLMVILAAPGCAWYRRSGGCLNCAFPSAMGTGSPVSSGEYLSQVEVALGHIPPSAPAPVQLDLYVSGSYLNPEEVPEDAQMTMVRRAASHPAIARITIESRPEYITPERLHRVKEAAGKCGLEVAIGLETAHDEIRAKRIRKGFTWASFERAARTVAENGADLLTYLLLKPLFTSEAEAIEDLVLSAGRVFQLGRTLAVNTRVALEPCFVAPGTRLEEEFFAGRYRPPWLWSVVEAVRRVAPMGEILVGMSDEGLEPARAAHNCEECTPRVLEALSTFNRTRSVEAFDNLSCACQTNWHLERSA